MNAPIVRRAWKAGDPGKDALLNREWLVTNGLGGYASGTIGGAPTRRYHGLLVAALPAPLGRMLMLNHLSELVRLADGSVQRFGGEERADGMDVHGGAHLVEFRLEAGMPVWRYEAPGLSFEKQVFMPHRQNTVHVRYRLLEGEPVRLKLRPAVHFRHHDAPVAGLHPDAYAISARGGRYELSGSEQLPPVRFWLEGERNALTLDGKVIPHIMYRSEERRGYEHRGDVWTPGYFRADLSRDHPVTLIASVENWETMMAMSPEAVLRAELERRELMIAEANPAARSGFGIQMILAADQFMIAPVTRTADAARAHAAGDEARSVIAGYHWFTDWGRDTMISLEGLALATGRQIEAGYILRTFANYVRDGLIPNLFPEGENQGLYHTADASLWFFHAVDRYLEYTGDRGTLRVLLPRLQEIVKHHVHGTRFGIGVDPADGLVRQGEAGYQLTWMDAKVGDWVVTPRRGKAVEINGLWYNAVRLLEDWTRTEQGDTAARPLAEWAERCYLSFNRRFWYEEGRFLYDVVDGERGDDASCRPNQIMSMSLRHAVLQPDRWKPVLETVQRRLLTPFGLRSLAPGSPDYKPKYYGDLRSRDAAYHQGTVWAWLIGPFIDAWLRVHPEDQAGARKMLSSFAGHLNEACVGSISEIFDAEEPYTPRGCIAQAWSVAEVLRVWVKTGGTSGG